MKRIAQTKFKMGVGIIILYFIEGVLKTLLDSFPLTELLAAQGAVALGFMGIQLARDKFGNGRES